MAANMLMYEITEYDATLFNVTDVLMACTHIDELPKDATRAERYDVIQMLCRVYENHSKDVKAMTERLNTPLGEDKEVELRIMSMQYKASYIMMRDEICHIFPSNVLIPDGEYGVLATESYVKLPEMLQQIAEVVRLARHRLMEDYTSVVDRIKVFTTLTKGSAKKELDRVFNHWSMNYADKRVGTYHLIKNILIAGRYFSCHLCNDMEAAPLFCSRCRSIIYCSERCSKLDWSRHKVYCKI
jgi:hypothetical protein